MKTTLRLAFTRSSTSLIALIVGLSGASAQAGSYSRFTLQQPLPIVGTHAYIQNGIVSQTKPSGESCLVSYGQVSWVKQSGFAPAEAAKGVAKFFGMFLWGEGIETSHITLKSELSLTTRGEQQGHVTVQPGTQIQQYNALFTSGDGANGRKTVWLECPSIASADTHLVGRYFSVAKLPIGGRETALNSTKVTPISASEGSTLTLTSVGTGQDKKASSERKIAGATPRVSLRDSMAE